MKFDVYEKNLMVLGYLLKKAMCVSRQAIKEKWVIFRKMLILRLNVLSSHHQNQV